MLDLGLTPVWFSICDDILTWKIELYKLDNYLEKLNTVI